MFAGFAGAILAVVLGSLFVLDKLESSQQRYILQLKAEITSMEFSLQKISDTELALVYHFTDVQGKVCSEDFTKTMRGSELFIDCVVVPVRGDQLAVFPDRIYTDLVEPIRGLSIINQYNVAGSPSIFTGVTQGEAKSVRKIYTKILRKESSQDWFRSSPHVSATPEMQWYRLVARYRGGIELVKVKK